MIEADEYAQGLMEYVHLNPVRPRRKGARLPAERAAELDAYRWSSHRAYAGLAKKPADWWCRDWLRYWGAAPAHRSYRPSVARWFAKPVENPWEQLVGGLVLGGEGLVAKVNAGLRQKAAREEAAWVRQRQSAALRPRLGEVLGSEADVRVKIWARVRLGGERGVSVAGDHGYQDGSAVGKVVRRLEQRSAHDGALRAKLSRIKANVASVQS